MYTGRIVFSQLIDFMPLQDFRRCVRRYRGDHRVRSFSCLDQFLCMAFAQLTFRESLRDIETCLRAMYPKLSHAGLRGKVSRSTLADANETRDWRIYADFAQVLIGIARGLYAKDSFGVTLEQTAYVFDSTTIDLCLTLFPWAQFRRYKSAVKLIPFWTCEAVSPVLCTLPAEERPTARLWTNCLWRPGPSTSWIEDTSISPDSTGSPPRQRTLSFAPRTS